MKYAVIIFVLFIAILGSLFVYSSSAANKLTNCYFKGGQTVANIHYKNTKGDLDDYDKCKETKKLIDEIGVCYNSVKQTTVIPIEYLEYITYITTPEFTSYYELVDIHNENCPYLKVELPSEEDLEY